MNVSLKTWATFKAHFTCAQSALKKIRGPTMEQAGFHHANMLADQLRANLEAQSSAMLAMVQESTTDNNPPIVSNNPPAPAANASVSVGDPVQLEMLCLLREIALGRQERAPRQNSRPSNSSASGDNEGGRSRIRKTPDNATFLRRATDSYCWTHGGCNHDSKDCNRKARGHKDAATRTNRMDGPNAFCGSSAA